MSILQKTTVSDLKIFSSVKFLGVLLLMVFSFSSFSQCASFDSRTSMILAGAGSSSTRIGTQFTVNSPIIVSRLGVFDSGGNGINTGITVGIVNAGGTVVVPSTGTPMSITGNTGTLVGRFLMNGGFTEVTLMPGIYFAVAFGFDMTDRYGDATDIPANQFTGGGLITFGGEPYDNTAAMGIPVGSTDPPGTFHAVNFTFRAVQPRLSTNLNGVNVTTTNDGRPDTATVVVCSQVNNITLGAFANLAGSMASDTSVKAYMQYADNGNVTFTGNIPANWNFPSARRLSDYNGFVASLKKTNPALPASATFIWRAFVDSDGNSQIGAGECPGDSIVYIVNFETTPPVISGCPGNITLNIQRPGICDTIATWATPTVADASPCSGGTITRTAGPMSGTLFKAGTTTTITYTAVDSSGNTATCSFTVTVNDFVNPSLGCKPVNLSLDEDCEGVLTPTDVLTGWEHVSPIPQLGCDTLYKITVYGSNGQSLGDTIRNDQVGKTLKYSIRHPNGFTCWNTVLVEDKIKPTIICPSPDITVNCLADLANIAPPEVTDNCSGVKAVLVSYEHFPLKCDPIYIGKIARTWKAVDAGGLESITLCTDSIFILRSTFTGITPPPVNPRLQCSSNYKRDDRGLGYPHPDTTGVPMFGSQKLWPLPQLNMIYCNATIDYADNLLLNTGCKTKIMRSWTITEWHCDSVKIIPVGIQIIDIIDTIAPVIPKLVEATFSTQSRSCTGLVTFPTLDITDNCNTVYHVYINAKKGGPSGYIDGNGGTMVLTTGAHSITYTAFDNCGNSSIMEYRITVVDETDPVALCDQFATVSLKTNGYTEITATAVDDGSYDECGPVTLKIRRMDDPCGFGADTAWFDKVGFCCLDANTTRMVQLLVTDGSGNTNLCMVSVQVQDKINPSVTCPSDITISDCLFTFDPANPATFFGAITISDNCPSNNTVKDTITADNRTQCGIGTVIRTVTVSQGNTIFSTCSQTITFLNLTPFNGATIRWPRDTLFTGQCSAIGLDTSVTGAPRFVEDACDMVGLRYEDQVFSFTTNGACFKIIRTWTVLDWCQRNSDNTAKTWTWEQEIKVMDTIKPVINLLPAATFETLDCDTGDILLSATATDCTPAADQKWSWVIKQGNVTKGTGTGSSVTDEFELGDYTITWTVEDRCGNSSSGTQNFRIVTKKAPTAVCKQGLASPLVLMDTNGDAIGDTYMTLLRPSFFDNKSSHACDPNMVLKLSFSANVNDTIRNYICDSVGVKTVRMYVTDIYGNQSFCQTFVDIQATNAQCPNVSPLVARVGGKTVKENNEEIESVTVEMKGSEQNAVQSDKNGIFSFAPTAIGGAYQIEPTKDGDDLNGISTLDIVMIQRHILGIEKLKTPYQIIAADANNNGLVTAADLTELRRLVLGLIPSFPNNTSWRFVDAGFKFSNPQDPWMTPFAEKYNIDKLSSNMDINFIGIKIGDVNGNSKSKNFSNDVTDSRSKVNLTINDVKVNRGDIIEIPVMASSSETMYGMQAQVKANGLIIREVKEGQVKLRYDDVIITDVNEARLSIVATDGIAIHKSEVIFIIEVEALKSGNLSEMLQLGQGITPELYTTEMETKNLALSWRSNSLKEFMLTGTAPNPWNTHTVLTFDLPKDGMVTFKVKDYTGRKVVSSIEQFQGGHNTIQINRSDIGLAGVYIYEIKFEDKVLSGKMIVID